MYEPILYHFHISYAAQIARLGLAEAGLPYKSFSLNLFEGENYQPWYMEINPEGVVPTYVSGETTIAGSLNIVRYAASHKEALLPQKEDDIELMEHWIERHQSVPERELTYALMPGMAGKVSRNSFSSRIKLLAQLRTENPSLAEAYSAKIEDLKQWEHDCKDPVTVEKMEREFDALLDDFAEHMKERIWVVGEQYTIADVLWTVLSARMFMMGMHKKITTRPPLKDYIRRAQGRASFSQAPVYMKLAQGVALPLMLRARVPLLRPFIKIKR